MAAIGPVGAKLGPAGGPRASQAAVKPIELTISDRVRLAIVPDVEGRLPKGDEQLALLLQWDTPLSVAEITNNDS